MKGKFITGILTIAVLLGLLLVPATGVSVSAGDPPAGQATLLLPATVKVLPGGSFAVNVTIYNPHNIAITSTGADMVWSTPSMLGVSSVDWGVWPTHIARGWDNATGEVYCTEGGSTEFPNITTTNIAHATVHFVAGSTEGVVTLSFIAAMTDATLILEESSTDICNWTPGDMQNLTVYIGTPKLTVDVSPAGKGAVKADGVLLVGYPNTTDRSWDAVVSLQAVNPAAGWAFDHWSGDVIGSANPTSVTMDALTKNVTANFVELPPILDVDPLTLDFSARYGDNTDVKTVTISNDGGGTLCWALGEPPAWSVGDVWSYWNTYDTVPNPAPPPDFLPYPNPYWSGLIPCAVNDTVLNLTVVGEDADNYYGFADWPITDPQRTANTTLGKIPCCLQDASVVVNKATLDYVQQLANLTLYLPSSTPGQALVTWTYTGCHGWPYYAGKTWFYTMTVTDATGQHPPVPAQAMVTAGPITFGPFTDVYVITHATPNMAGQVFMQQYWSDTARNFVYQWDGGTFNAPPLDIRQLTGFSVSAPAPAVPPAWLSFDKTHGSLGTGASEVLTVTANTSGLNVTPPLYTTSFDITAPGSIQVKTVNVSLEVLAPTTIDVVRNLPADALDMDAEYPGDTFDVWVNFTAPVDNFNAIGLTDLAPAGWAVQTDVAWCSPAASETKGEGNKAEYAWFGAFGKGTVFSAKYKVTIPATAANGWNYWPNNDGTKAWAEYWFAADGPYTSNVTGEHEKMITVPGKIVGETRDVNADLLTTTLVVCDEQPLEIGDEPEDSDSSTAPAALYKIDVDDTGQYWMEASKYCYFPLDTWSSDPLAKPTPFLIDFGDTAKLAAGWVFDFEGDWGLVPKACTMSYAMKSVNHWLFQPTGHPEWQLSNWKAMESVHSWQFPTGCNL